MSCELSRAGTPVRWLKDRKAIRKSQKYDLVTEGTWATLVVRAVSLKDSGEYTCETEASKSTASLRVEGDPTGDPGMGPLASVPPSLPMVGAVPCPEGLAWGLHNPQPPLLPTASQKRPTGLRRS